MGHRGWYRPGEPPRFSRLASMGPLPGWSGIRWYRPGEPPRFSRLLQWDRSQDGAEYDARSNHRGSLPSANSRTTGVHAREPPGECPPSRRQAGSGCLGEPPRFARQNRRQASRCFAADPGHGAQPNRRDSAGGTARRTTAVHTLAPRRRACEPRWLNPPQWRFIPARTTVTRAAS